MAFLRHAMWMTLASRARLAVWAALASGIGCGYTIPDGRLVCDEGRVECPPGFSCIASRCTRAVEAGRADTSILDAGRFDASVDAFGIDAASTDAHSEDSTGLATDVCSVDRDMDGFCAERDCDDEHELVNPGQAERCTSSPVVGGTPKPAVDEDCDGSIDETCAWHVGVPHWITDTTERVGEHVSPSFARDGRVLYACVEEGCFVCSGGERAFVDRCALWPLQRRIG
jgi:hypothetical protein